MARLRGLTNSQPASREVQRSMLALKLDRVGVQIGGLTALRSVSFSCARGEVTVIVGPNGSGKTTLLNVLSGFVAPSEGEVHLSGVQVTRFNPAEIRRLGSGVSRSFQNPVVVSALSAVENVLVGRRVRGESVSGVLKAMAFKRSAEHTLKMEAREILEEMDFFPRDDVVGAELSAGQRRKTDVARALFAESTIVLLDEPLATVDRRGAEGIVSLILRAAGAGRSVVVVEHRLHYIRGVADRLIELEAN